MNYSLLFISLLFVQGLNINNLQEALEFNPFSIKDCTINTDFLQAFEIFTPWIKMIEDEEIDVQKNQLKLQGIQEMISELALLSNEEKAKQIDNNDQNENNNNQSQENQDLNQVNDIQENQYENKIAQFQQELLLIQSDSSINKFFKNINNFSDITNQINQEKESSDFNINEQLLKQLNEMIQFGETLVNMMENKDKIIEELKDKQQTIQHLAKNCGQSLSGNSEQLLEKAKQYKNSSKQKRKNQVSFLQVVMEDEDTQHHQLEYQKQLLQNQGMLGFLRTQGK